MLKDERRKNFKFFNVWRTPYSVKQKRRTFNLMQDAITVNICETLTETQAAQL